MALQTKTFTANGSNGNHYFTLTVTENSTNIANNTSSITYSFKLACWDSSWQWEGWGGNYISYSVSINGSQVKTGTIPNFYGSTMTLVSDTTINVAHNSDGKKNMAVAFSVTDTTGQYYTCGSASASGSVTLTAIPRQATLNSATSFNDSGNPSITYSNPAGTAVTSLQACISFTGASADVPYRDVSKTGSSYTFSLTDTERTTLKNHFPSATSGTVLIYLRTVIGGNTFYSSKSVTFTIQNNSTNQPTVSIAVSPDNTLIDSTYRSNFAGVYVAGKSKVTVTTTASAKFGASISSRTVTVDSVVKTGAAATYTTPNPIANSGTKNVSSQVTDTRGFAKTASTTISVQAYITPYISNAVAHRGSSATRDDTKTTIYISAKKSYSSVSGKNKCLMQYRTKAENGSWGSWTTLSARTATSDTYSGTISGFPIANSYTLQLRVIDDIGSISEPLSFNIPSESVPLELYEGGKKVGIGNHALATDYTIHMGWDTYYEGTLYIKVGGTFMTLADYIRSIV